MADRPRSIYPDLKQYLTETTAGSTICSYSCDKGDPSPILTLFHGYPQSAFEYVLILSLSSGDANGYRWRHVREHVRSDIGTHLEETDQYIDYSRLAARSIPLCARGLFS